MRFPLVQLRAHWIGVVRTWIAENEYVDRRMPEIQTGVHVATLPSGSLLDFDLVAHLGLVDFRNSFAGFRVPYDDEFPGLGIASRRGPSGRLQDRFDGFIRDWFIFQKSGANASPPSQYI